MAPTKKRRIGRRPIPLATARAVLAMLAVGERWNNYRGELSYRKVAKKTGINPTTVLRIKHGRGPYAAVAREAIAPDPDPDWPGKHRRCTCGARLQPHQEIPCLACRLQPAIVERHQAAVARAAKLPGKPGR